MVLGGPIAKSDLNVSKLNFNNVEQMKKYTQKLYGVVWLILVGHTQLVNHQKKLKT